MKALAITGFGTDRLALVDIAEPRPGPGEVLIHVLAAGLNPADWKLRDGWLRGMFSPSFPYVLGFDAAGVVGMVGDGVVGLLPGDRVIAKTAVGRGGGGAMTEAVAVPSHLVRKIPDGFAFTDAAALPTAGIAGWEALFVAGGLSADQSILVNGGAGGTGSIVVALARHAGARVIATARPENAEYLSRLGAEATLDYRSDDVPARVRDWIPGGVDLVIDTVGMGTMADPLRSIRDGGRMVTIATLSSAEGELAPERDITIVTAMSSREREGEQLAALVHAFAVAGVPMPQVDLVAPGEAGLALERLKAGHVRGKLVLDLAGGAWRHAVEQGREHDR